VPWTACGTSRDQARLQRIGMIACISRRIRGMGRGWLTNNSNEVGEEVWIITGLEYGSPGGERVCSCKLVRRFAV